MPARFSLPVALAVFAVWPAVAQCQDNNAAPRPVGVQELSLLLRSGYTGDEVLKETAGRPLLAPIDAAAERALLEAGADAHTVAALREGRRVVSSTEAADVQQRQAAADQHRLDSWETDQTRRAQAGQQAVRQQATARREEELKTLAKGLHGKLVVCKDNRLVPYDETALANKKIFLFYTAAGSDKASRQLTAQLVDFYKRFAPAHPDFETVLLSADRSAAEMARAMQADAMPWPAMIWEELAKQPDLANLGKNGTPRLVLIDGSGTPLADNFEKGKLVSPQHVIDVLTGNGAAKPGAPTAAR